MMGSGLLLTTGALLSLVFESPAYQATARISLQKEAPPDPATRSDTNVPAFDPYWIQTESEKIQAKVNLYPVITNLNLHLRWTPKRGIKAPLSLEEAYRLLIGQLEVRQLRSTSLIEISVFSEDAAEAAQIASTIAQVYRDLRNARPKDSGRLLPIEVVQIVDQAEVPSHPARGRRSLGLLPVILFAVGLVDILVGYALVRPTLSAGDGKLHASAG